MKFGENQSAMRTVAARALLLSAVAALTLGPLLPVFAAESDKDPVTTSAIGPVKMRFLSLGSDDGQQRSERQRGCGRQ